jgi:hypothetical protein
MPRDFADEIGDDAAKVVTLNIWPEPKPLPGGLLPVDAFDIDLLPASLRSWVNDVAERMQTPADFVGVTAMVAAGSVIGRKIGIRPMLYDDWTVVPNQFACIIGRPGVMKSPAVTSALKPFSRLEAKAALAFQSEKKLWDAESDERELRGAGRKAQMAKLLKDNPAADVSHLRAPVEQEPTLHRYKAVDSSYQALGELLRHNSNGVLVHRDEIMSLLRSLDREDNAEARGFYLTGWNGADNYVFDRIGRGANLTIPSVTLSVLGSTQPGMIQGYVRNIMSGSGSDDGLLQRFSMMVWPDMPKTWVEHDREPDAQFRQQAFDAFDHLDTLTPEQAGAQQDQYSDGKAFLRFDAPALAEFRQWREGLEHRLRSNELHPAIESHLAKYRKLVPALALIHHLTGFGSGPVGVESVIAALAWAKYLESHAHRVYQAGAACAVDGAQVILRNLRSGRLDPDFSGRDIYHKNWSPLGDDMEKIKQALALLEDHGWLRSIEMPTSARGGRPTTRYIANPKGLVR